VNVTVIVVERLGWDAQLATLTYSPPKGVTTWVARLDAYDSDRSGPFHFLDPRLERSFRRDMRKAERRARRPIRYEPLSDGRFRFTTEWRAVPTKLTGMSCYALCLPAGAAVDRLAFTDPSTGKEYRYNATYDRQQDCIASYLECRSENGSFDFDVTVEFHRDAAACRNFPPITGASPWSDLRELERLAEPRSKPKVVQQFFAGSTSIEASQGSVVITGGTVQSPVVGDASGTIGAIGDGATGSVTADLTDVLAHERDKMMRELQVLKERVAGLEDAGMYRAVAETIDAANAGDDRGVAAGLRRLGRAGLDVAREVGVSLVVALIQAQLHVGG
jgi:hypothetical protein